MNHQIPDAVVTSAHPDSSIYRTRRVSPALHDTISYCEDRTFLETIETFDERVYDPFGNVSTFRNTFFVSGIFRVTFIVSGAMVMTGVTVGISGVAGRRYRAKRNPASGILKFEEEVLEALHPPPPPAPIMMTGVFTAVE